MAKVSRRQTLGLGLGAGLSVTMMTGRDEAQAAPANVTFSLLLVNDIYKMSDDKGRGGFAKLAARGEAGAGARRADAVRARRRYLLALAHVGLRPGRAHRRADQHDPAGRLRARQPRVRLRQGRLFQAHGRIEVSVLRRQHAPGRRFAYPRHEGSPGLRAGRREGRRLRPRALRRARHVAAGRHASSGRSSTP